MAESMTLSKGGVRVALNDEEAARLRAILAERDRRFAEYDAQWEQVFADACKRSGVLLKDEEGATA